MDKKILEKDLYRPVANFLLEQGFDVRSEVKNCDIMAVRGEEIVLIELKRNFQMKLLYQAIDRQTRATKYMSVFRGQQKHRMIANGEICCGY